MLSSTLQRTSYEGIIISRGYYNFTSRFSVANNQLVIHGDHVLGGAGILSRFLSILRPLRREYALHRSQFTEHVRDH